MPSFHISKDIKKNCRTTIEPTNKIYYLSRTNGFLAELVAIQPFSVTKAIQFLNRQTPISTKTAFY